MKNRRVVRVLGQCLRDAWPPPLHASVRCS